MNILVLFLLCIVQGLTEFLPVSSSGHLLFFEQIFGIQSNLLLINLFLHLATLLAVVIVYRKAIFDLLKRPFQSLSFKLVLSTAITVCFAVAYKKLGLESTVTKFYGLCFVATAILLFVTDKYQKNAVIMKQHEISTKSAIVVGIVQGFAVLPGVSRSGSTISSLVLSGTDEAEASKFSFLLSIPIIIGGFVLECAEVKSWDAVLSAVSIPIVLVAFVLTFLVAMTSLKITVKMLKAKKFKWFAIYLLILGVTVCAYNFLQ